MKIALICDHFLPQIGGIEVHVADLARQLTQAGHEAHVITSMPGKAVNCDFPVHRLSVPLIPGSQVIRNRRAFRVLKKLLVQEKFEVFHCHNSIVSPLAYGSLKLAAQQKIPAVLTTHSLFSVGSISFFRFMDLIYRIRDWPVLISGVSQEACRRLKKAFPKHSVLTLPNGIDGEFWKVESNPDPRPRLTMVLRLHKKKRPLEVLKILPHIKKQFGPSDPPVLSVVGDGPQRNLIEKKIRELDLENDVELHGRLNRKQIREILAKTNLFLLPSPWESLPITALEAGCAGIPVVGMKQSGLRDIVEHGKNGMLAADYPELANHILALLKNNQQRQTMASNAQKMVEKFHWRTVVARHLAIYSEAIKRV